ncbi:Trp biosynthesis-associated membrane protein [Dermatophilaceae bacterium Sec6.4]
MTSKRSVFFLGLVAVLLLLLAASRTWVHGNIADAVLEQSKVAIGGSGAAPLVPAGALMGAAAVIALLTAGRIARLIATFATALAGVLAMIGALLVVNDPAAVVRARAATSTGRTGEAVVNGSLTFWPWVAVLGAAVLVAVAIQAGIGGRRWNGLSSRYDAPTAKVAQTSAWDRLSAGEDPTVDDPRDDGAHSA